MKYLIIFLLINNVNSDYLEDLIVNAKSSGKVISVFYATKIPEKFLRILNHVLSGVDQAFELSNELSERVPAQHQQQQNPRDTVLIFLENATDLGNIVRVIKSKRILNHRTCVYLVTETVTAKLDQEFWRRLKTKNFVTYSFEETEIIQNATKFNPGDFSLKMLALRNDEPYVVNNNRGRGLDGVCVRLIRTISSAMSVKVEEVLADEDPSESLLFPYNGTRFNGYLALLDQQELDIVCGSLTLYKPRFDAADILPPMSIDNLFWFMGKNRHFHKWKTFFTEFAATVWAAFFVTWFLLSIIFYTHFRIADNRLSFPTILIDLLGLLLENVPQRLRGRFRRISVFVLIYSLVINAGYKSGLLSKLTVPKPEQALETPQAGMDRGYVYMSYNSTDFLLTVIGESNPNHKRLIREKRVMHFVTTYELLDKILHNFTTLALLDDSDAKSTIIRRFLGVGGLDAFHVLPHAYIMQRKNVYMSPGHPLAHVFAAKQDYLIEAGFVNHWFREIYHDMAITAVGGFQQLGPKPIQLYHLSGLFYFYLICISFCLGLFFMEILCFSCGRN